MSKVRALLDLLSLPLVPVHLMVPADASHWTSAVSPNLPRFSASEGEIAFLRSLSLLVLRKAPALLGLQASLVSRDEFGEEGGALAKGYVQ